MYTWEIEKLLQLKNYIINEKDYLDIITTSPQIRRIKYDAYNDTIENWTKESDNSTKYFKYKVKKRTK